MQGPFQIYPYRRENVPKNDRIINRRQLFQRVLWFGRQWSRPKAIAFICIAFLLGRALLAQQLAPFGLAFLAAVLSRHRELVVPVLISVLVGEATRETIEVFWPNFFTYLTLIVAVPLIMDKTEGSVQLGVLTGAWALGIKAGFMTVVYQPVAFDYLLVAIEAVIAGALVPPMLLAMRAFKQPARDWGRFQEETGSLLVLVLAVVLGLDYSVGDYHIGVVLSKYLVLLASLGGAGWGAAFGAAGGLVPGLANFNGLVLAGLYSVSGMLAGFLRNWGKPGLLLGFFCGNLLYGFYFTDEAVLMDFLSTSGLAGVLLVLTPRGVIATLTERWFKQGSEANSLSCYMNDRFNRLIKLFDQLSSSYAPGIVAVDREQTWDRWLRSLVNQVCRDCGFARICWDEKEVNQSYRQLRRWLKALAAGGQEEPLTVMPAELEKRCPRTEELGASLAYINAIVKANEKWQERINKERKAVAAQLRGAAEALATVWQDWQSGSATRQPHLEETIQLGLEELGIQPAKLEIWKAAGSGLEVYLELTPCDVRHSACVRQVSSCISSGLDGPVLMKEHHCPPDKSEEKCRFKYVTMDEEGPELGIAQWPKEGNAVSGDTVAATVLTEDRWLFVLSDGMGSGEEAQKESSGVVRLLEQFLLLDFTLQEAVEMVNSLLLLKGEERFATVDLALLDLANKNLELAKIGAVPSLLINQGNCRVLESNSLPVGILEEIPVETVSLPLETGTVLIMTTDGVWQGPANDQREGWLPEYVQGLWHLSAKDLAQRIVEHSLIMHGGKAEDDLSVLVVRLDW